MDGETSQVGGRVPRPPARWQSLWQELVDGMLAELGEDEAGWEFTVPEGRPARFSAGPTTPRWRTVMMARTGKWHPPHPDFAGSGRLLLPVGDVGDPFRPGYVGHAPRRAFECPVCSKTKGRACWRGGVWRGFAMCESCEEQTVPVTFHATWTERLSRDAAFAEGDEIVVEGHPLAITRVDEGEGALAVWIRRD